MKKLQKREPYVLRRIIDTSQRLTGIQGYTGTTVARICEKVVDKSNLSIMDQLCDDPAFTSLSKSNKELVLFMAKLFDKNFTKLEQTIKLKDQKIEELEKRIDVLENKIIDFDCSERRDDIILSGPGLPCATDGEHTKTKVCEVLKNKLRITIKPEEIRSAFRLGTKKRTQGDDRRSFMVKLYNHSTKIEIIKACRTMKTNIYANDNLPPERKLLYDDLRKIRKDNPTKIKHLFTVDGVICIKKTSEGQPIRIRTQLDFDKCLEMLDIQIPASDDDE